MAKTNKIHRALLSVSDKSGIVDFARSLHALDIEIISTGGTAKMIAKSGIPVTPVEDVTGFPEMLDGRVKTLHPMIHGGLLGVRDNKQHQKAMSDYDIVPIDLICIDLYPFEATVAKPEVTEPEVIEQIDIGGPAMIRSAAKNFKFVTVITNTSQYESVIVSLKKNKGKTTLELRRDLANAAFARTASYDRTISQWMSQNDATSCMIEGSLHEELRYGENPTQQATVYAQSQQGVNVINAELLSGKAMSYNNYMDADSALELVQDLHSNTKLPSVAFIKHANPCGAAVDRTLKDAFNKAWSCDPLAAFGGIVSLSENITAHMAKTITHGERFIEVIIAPSFSDKAVQLLKKRWKNIRILATHGMKQEKSWTQFKSLQGGFVTQVCHPVISKPKKWDHVAGPNPTRQQLFDASVAWICVSHLKSNAISVAADGALIGGGMGQVDRVSASRLAVQRAQEALDKAKSPVAASDAFFPFSDGPEILINAGVKCIVQPGGSVRDKDTIKLCKERRVTLLMTGERCFRH